MFSSDWVVPPNTIDFSTVFDNFGGKLLENIHVFLTITLVIVFYFILVIILRRYDKKDVKKVRNWLATLEQHKPLLYLAQEDICLDLSF